MGVSSLVIATLSASSLVAAVNVKPDLPYDSQVGAFNLPLQCKVNGKSVKLSALISATAPIVVNPGQTVKFQDVTAEITVPASVIPSGTASVNVLANADLDLTNGSPSTVSVFPGGQWLNGTKVTAGKKIVLKYPKSGVLPAIGPVTAGSSGVTSLFLGDISAKAYPLTSSGAANGSPLTITCPGGNQFLANLNIDGASGNTTVNAPSTGVQFKPNPALKVGQIQGNFHTNYVCNLVGFQVPVDLVFGGAAVGSYPKGSSFSLGKVTSFLNVGQNWINAARSIYGAQTFETTVMSVDISITNASPSTFNPITTPITLSQEYKTSGGLDIIFPQTGYLQAGPFTATGAKGSYMSLTLGNSVAQVVIKNSKGKVVNNGTTTCVPAAPLSLFQVLIT